MAHIKKKNSADEQKFGDRAAKHSSDELADVEFVGVHVIDADDMEKHFGSSEAEESNDLKSDSNRR